jgi:hypothetical protein
MKPRKVIVTIELDTDKTLADLRLAFGRAADVLEPTSCFIRADNAATLEEVFGALRTGDAAQATEQVPPTDEEIEAWRKDATSVNATAVMRDGSMEACDDVFELHSTCIDEAIALMRRARPNPALLSAAKAVVEAAQFWVPSNRGLFSALRLDKLTAEVERASKGNRQVPLDSSTGEEGLQVRESDDGN